MTNREKIGDVLAGKELLRVDSLHKQLPNKTKKIIFVVITGMYGLGMFYSLLLYWGQSPLVFLIPAMITACYCISLILYVSFTSNKGNPLIFTEKGIVLPNITATYWNEIESYRWEDYTGWNQVPGPRVFSTSGGMTLHVNLREAMKELVSGWRAVRGGNRWPPTLFFSLLNRSSRWKVYFRSLGYIGHANNRRQTVFASATPLRSPTLNSKK